MGTITRYLTVLMTTLGFGAVTVGGPAAFAEPPRDAEASRDETIRSNVEKRLLLDDRITWSSLEVKVKDGRVSLYGMVKSHEERGLAAKSASTVPGVIAVTNNILVEPNLPGTRGSLGVERSAETGSSNGRRR